MNEQALPPTLEETQAALEKINTDATRRKDAAIALRELCEAVIRTVTAVDRSHNVGAFMRRIELIAKGEGNFELRLYEKDTGIDPDEIAREVAERLAADGGDYGKNLRPIQLGFTA